MPAIETLGDAYQAGWGVRMRCSRGDHVGIVRIDRCGFDATLSMETLVATRGRRFPLARLAQRLRCPNCGGERIQVAFDIPSGALPAFVAASPYRRAGQC
jgi:hypothetical protein